MHRLAVLAVVVPVVLTTGCALPPGARDDRAAHRPDPGSKAGRVSGEVLGVDVAGGRIALRHDPIPSLGMSAMTMVFVVPDRRLLEGVKTGDRVRFAAERIDGGYAVTAIEPAR